MAEPDRSRRKSRKMSEDKDFIAKLKQAVISGDIKIARRLIKGGVSINPTFWFHTSLLHDAVAQGRPEMVKVMLQAKAKVNAVDKTGRTPLHIACRRGHIEIVKLLIDNEAQVNALTKDGRTGLHTATWKGHTGIADILLDAGASVNQQDEDGWTPLHWAAKINLASLAERMIQHGANINIQDKHGRTPLHENLASQCTSNLLMVKALLEHGADPNIQPDRGTTLGLLMAQEDYNVACVQLLLDTGYNPIKDSWICREHLPDSDEMDVRTQIRFRQEHVASLAELTRSSVRRHLSSVHCGRTIVPHIQDLPVPEIVKNYLALEEELGPRKR